MEVEYDFPGEHEPTVSDSDDEGLEVWCPTHFPLNAVLRPDTLVSLCHSLVSS